MIFFLLVTVLHPSPRDSSSSRIFHRQTSSSGRGSTGSSTRGLHSFRPLEEDESDLVAVKPGNLSCYTCQLDFRKKQYETNHPCLGRHDGLKVNEDFLVSCGPRDFYCRAERTEVNGVLITLVRECSNVCYYGCRPKGFGISYESCAECCTSHGCNNMYPVSSAVTSLLSFWLIVLEFFILAMKRTND
ncbi:hypothetical protein SK128_007054 [Halocaridina rubra]|uniref:C2H2-type domain-containing protein n=1 Tax=Halocaridina rubra TaxID=373956 RepID=A0AAN8XI64_HALRR